MARSLYRWIAFAAIPGTLWSAFEMYVLTLGGAQMLFFSIVHTMPLLVVVVLVGLVSLTLFVIKSATAVLLPAYRAKLAIPRQALGALAGLASLHVALLLSYEVWSSSGLRIVVCIVGLFSVGLLLALSARHLRKVTEAHAST